MASQSREHSVVSQGPSSCKKTVLRDQYEVLGDIGHGRFGQIQLARHRLTGAEVAIKVLLKRGRNRLVLSEADIMGSLAHPSVIQLFQVLETDGAVYMVMEHARGGQLLDHIPQGGMQEEEARRLFQQVVCAVAYCHDRGIVRGDLKAENTVVDATGHIQIIDFGLSTWVTSRQRLAEFRGTLTHIAPEIILRQAYEGPPADIWSLGVMLHFMLTGSLPFMAPKPTEVMTQIMRGVYHEPPQVSLAAKILLQHMLTLDPRKRPTAKRILLYPWMVCGEQYLPHDHPRAIPTHPDPEILTIMFDMGYDLRKTRASLAKRKYNEDMGTYLLLQHQKSQGVGYFLQGKPVLPRGKPAPPPMDLAHSPVLPKRSSSEPVLCAFPLPSEPPQHVEAKPSGQKHLRRASQPPIHLHCPPSRTRTPRLPSQPHSGQPHAFRKLWKRVTRRIAICVGQLCGCIPRASNKVAQM